MILVTGGIGFIGSHVCHELVKREEDILIFDNIKPQEAEFLMRVRMPEICHKVKLVLGDITDFANVFSVLKKFKVKSIIHTAALSFIPTAIQNPSLTFNINTVGTFNLLEAGRICNVKKFIFLSSSSTYGDFQYQPADEKHPLEPKDIYGATKAAADRLVISYYRTYKLPAAVVRITSVYGPGDLENRVGKLFIEKALSGSPVELHGGGGQFRDFTYVKDIAQGITKAHYCRASTGEVFNISYGSVHTIKDFAYMVKHFIPDAEIKEVGERKIDVNRGQMDITKAKKILKYKPQYSMKEGIQEYVKWVVNYYAPFAGLKIKNKALV